MKAAMNGIGRDLDGSAGRCKCALALETAWAVKDLGNGEGVRVQRTGSTAMGRLGTMGAPVCTVFYTVIHGL